jgi:hypothetical protein
MKRLLNYLKEKIAFGKVTKPTLVAIATLGLLSCEPEMCEDCYTYTYSDGSTEWMCVEYDCSDY